MLTALDKSMLEDADAIQLGRKLAEVTVPPSGPPRPIQLAISDGKNFRVLDLR